MWLYDRIIRAAKQAMQWQTDTAKKDFLSIKKSTKWKILLSKPFWAVVLTILLLIAITAAAGQILFVGKAATHKALSYLPAQFTNAVLDDDTAEAVQAVREDPELQSTVDEITSCISGNNGTLDPVLMYIADSETPVGDGTTPDILRAWLAYNASDPKRRAMLQVQHPELVDTASGEFLFTQEDVDNYPGDWYDSFAIFQNDYLVYQESHPNVKNPYDVVRALMPAVVNPERFSSQIEVIVLRLTEDDHFFVNALRDRDSIQNDVITNLIETCAPNL